MLAVIVVIIDQFADWLIRKLLSEQGLDNYPVTTFFNFVSVENTGVSFGLLQNVVGGKWMLLALASIITAVLIFWLFRTTSLWTSCALGLVIGGAIGNMIERLRDGAVFDFLDFHAYGWHWPAFNLTDTAIVAGVIALMYLDFRKAYLSEKKKGRI